MIDPNVLLGLPLTFCGKIKIYPPKVKDVISNPKFNMFYSILTFSQDDVREELQKKVKDIQEIPSVFEYLLLNIQYVDGFANLFTEAIEFFCQSNITFLLEEKAFILQACGYDQENENSCLINEENFFFFQNKIREANGDKPLQPPIPDDPDEDPRIRRIKEKARERDRIKAKQGNKDGISLGVCLSAICCMGIGITPLNIGEMSYASVGIIMKMMQDKEKYDIDIRSLLAGADSKKIKPKYWIRNSDKD